VSNISEDEEEKTWEDEYGSFSQTAPQLLLVNQMLKVVPKFVKAAVRQTQS
jgi:hypothetical protein